MDFANSLLQLVNNTWGLASRPLGYICNLKDNVESLRNATDGLKAKIKDVLATVEREERGGGVQRTKEVVHWLDKVQKFVGRVDQIVGRADQIIQEAGVRDQINCLSRCLSPNFRSSYKLGKRIDQMLNEMRELQPKERQFDVVTMPLPPPLVNDMPMDEIVGLDTLNLREAWKWVKDKKQGGVIGLYGIGGVGKTTLMRRIEKELSRTNDGFYVVIWVDVCRQANKDRIQDVIRKRLEIEDKQWIGWSCDDKVGRLCKALTQKKFVLLLDDLWERLELAEIGVPRPGPQDGSKVVFTTRLKQGLGADKTFEVPCLMPKEALELFENNVGKSTIHSHPQIPDLAKKVARECKGLPLALKVVGRAMDGRLNPGDWKHALATLRNNPHKLSTGMEEMYHKLAFSYYSLVNPTLQLCFLYCCLFPEDYLIRTDKLIELWIGGGLLGDTDDVCGMRNEGEHVLGSLKIACLLESGSDSFGEQSVKMHGVIRDMATWITRDRGENENKLLVIENEEDMSAGVISKWGEAKKVSLWGNSIGNIEGTLPVCSQLETLFVRETKVTFLPSGFFDSTTARLTVLNLSDNKNILSFPEGICDLIYLRYLNLSGTGISELPKEIKNLDRLRWLLLDDMWGKKILIPTGAIKSLPLNVFSQWNRGILQSDQGKEEEMVEELECMQHLTDLSIRVCESSSAQKIFQSPKLRRCIRRVRINDVNGKLTSIVITYSPTSIEAFLHLEMLSLFNNTELREMKITQEIGRAPNDFCFPNLVEVSVYRCGLSDLSWLVHAPELQKLSVENCDSMERIIGDGFAKEELAASRLFSHLGSLELRRLPKLTSICDQALSFPHGVLFDIWKCPGLRKLPLDSSSARGSFEVKGDKLWWAEFEWDPTARVTLQLGSKSLVEEMTFEEAASKVKDESPYLSHKIIFLSRGGPSE